MVKLLPQTWGHLTLLTSCHHHTISQETAEPRKVELASALSFTIARGRSGTPLTGSSGLVVSAHVSEVPLVPDSQGRQVLQAFKPRSPHL